MLEAIELENRRYGTSILWSIKWSTSVGFIHVSLFYTLESFKVGSFSQNNIISWLISFWALDFGLIYYTSLHVNEYIVPSSNI